MRCHTLRGAFPENPRNKWNLPERASGGSIFPFFRFPVSLPRTIPRKKAEAKTRGALTSAGSPPSPTTSADVALPLALRLGLPTRPFAPGKSWSSCRSRPCGISFASACSSGRKRAPNVGIELFKGVGRWGAGAGGMCASGCFPGRRGRFWNAAVNAFGENFYNVTGGSFEERQLFSQRGGIEVVREVENSNAGNLSASRDVQRTSFF